MHLLNVAVAATSAIVGTAGAAAAYGALNTPPVHPPAPPAPTTVLVYSDCEAPAVLTDGMCITTVVRTVVKKPKPRIITIVQRPAPSHGKSGATKSAHHDRDDDGDDHDDDEHGDDDHGDDGGDHGNEPEHG